MGLLGSLMEAGAVLHLLHYMDSLEKIPQSPSCHGKKEATETLLCGDKLYLSVQLGGSSLYRMIYSFGYQYSNSFTWLPYILLQCSKEVGKGRNGHACREEKAQAGGERGRRPLP